MIYGISYYIPSFLTQIGYQVSTTNQNPNVVLWYATELIDIAFINSFSLNYYYFSYENLFKSSMYFDLWLPYGNRPNRSYAQSTNDYILCTRKLWPSLRLVCYKNDGVLKSRYMLKFLKLLLWWRDNSLWAYLIRVLVNLKQKSRFNDIGSKF